MTHPAFLSIPSTGYWVGKFETGYDGATTKEEAVQNIYEPTCGFINVNEECNKYCSDGSCNTAYPNSVLASTTNNISGVFDMSGGSWEHMMGVTLDEEGKPLSGRNSLSNSGFNGAFGCPTCDNDTSGLTSLTDGYAWPKEKYYDTYMYSNKYLSYKNAILGDATAEVGPFANDEIRHSISSWYKDYAVLVFASYPIHQRGSTYESGTEGGTFAFGPNGGASSYNVSFRIILTI